MLHMQQSAENSKETAGKYTGNANPSSRVTEKCGGSFTRTYSFFADYSGKASSWLAQKAADCPVHVHICMGHSETVGGKHRSLIVR